MGSVLTRTVTEKHTERREGPETVAETGGHGVQPWSPRTAGDLGHRERCAEQILTRSPEGTSPTDTLISDLWF